MAYGKRLLPSVVDEQSKADPERVIYSYSTAADPSKGFRDVTTRAFANAVNKMALLLMASLGNPSDFEVIGYIGPSDIRFAILALAAMKTGYVMLFNSPRNSLDGHINVTTQSSCKIWAVPDPRPAMVDDILDARQMRTVLIPDLDHLLNDECVEVYRYKKTFSEAIKDPVLVLHTSGSTGFPKPITWTHETLAIFDKHHDLPPIEGKSTLITDWASDERMIYSGLPHFHAAGAFFHIGAVFFYGLRIAFGPASVPINTHIISNVLESRNDFQGVIVAPAILEEIAGLPEYLVKLRNLRFVAYAGGALHYAAGTTISKICRVDNCIGSTEGAMYAVLVADPDDWQYFHYHDDSGFEFEQVSENIFEQVSVFDTEKPKYHTFHVTFPDQKKISTKDRYTRHPTKTGRWLYRGRADDIIVLSNGEKFNPTDMEANIAGHPAVRSAIITGQGRFQISALIELLEPTANPVKLETVTDSLQATIEEANRVAPAHARLQPGFIIFAHPSKPFVRAAKGTVIRAATSRMYEYELSRLYESSDVAVMSEVNCIDIHDPESTSSSLLSLVEKLIGKPIKPRDDMFAAGLDSLLVFQITQSLNASIPPTRQSSQLSNTLVYANPTVEQLANAFFKIVRSEDNSDQTDDSNIHAIEDVVTKYTSNLPRMVYQHTISPGEKLFSIILTGSTGSLGTYLLDALLKIPHVRRVYCLNRSLDSRSQQHSRSSTCGLSTNWPEERVRFFRADLSKSKFGLNGGIYDDLLHDTTHIIHNQWPVNFNWSLSSFEPHIAGVRNLVDFTAQSQHNASIFFVSSIATVENNVSNKPVPEAPVTDLSCASMGYGSSKLAAELVLQAAGEQSKIVSSVCRVGQIAGPIGSERGQWNPKEWLPTIIATSAFMAKIPSTLAGLDICSWVPVDIVANIILELADIIQNPNLGPPVPPMTTTPVYHLQNSHGVPWSTLLPQVQQRIGQNLQTVSWDEWISALEESRRDANQIGKNPGLPLLDFYQNLTRARDSGKPQVILDLTNAMRDSRSLREMLPVNDLWMERWMHQWGYRNQVE